VGMMRKILYGLLAACLLLSACSNSDSTADHDGKDADRDPKSESGGRGGNLYPLTGLYTNDPADNRIIGVMINNHSEARPQSGLSQADIVFEILAESNITRFLALFQSEVPEKIGPVRSAREYYFDLADGYDSLYVYHGAADFIDQKIVNEGISFLNGAQHDNDGQLFVRETFRQAPHNSYLLGSAVYDAAEDKGYNTAVSYQPLPFLEDSDMENIEGESASHVEIVYSEEPLEIVEYSFDADSGKYQRYSDREQTLEYETSEPVEVSNVFIIETHHEVIDDQGRRAVDLESGGNAYLIQNGKAQYVAWKNDNGRIVPVKDGEPLGFIPGKTWVNVVPMSPSMEQSVIITGDVSE